MTILDFTIILIFHFIADFILQDEDWAVNKSIDDDALLKHTITYSIVWYIPMIFMLGIWKSALFVTITFILHTLTDYITSRIVSKKFQNKEYGSSIPNFGAFTIIGFDQLIHYITLVYTFKLISLL